MNTFPYIYNKLKYDYQDFNNVQWNSLYCCIIDIFTEKKYKRINDNRLIKYLKNIDNSDKLINYSELVYLHNCVNN